MGSSVSLAIRRKVRRCFWPRRWERSPPDFERLRELLQPPTHRIKEPTGVGLVLEAGDQIVGIAHDDHVAAGLEPPAFGPEVEDVVRWMLASSGEITEP